MEEKIFFLCNCIGEKVFCSARVKNFKFLHVSFYTKEKKLSSFLLSVFIIYLCDL